MIEDNISSLFSSDNWWGSVLIISTLAVLIGVAAEALLFVKCIRQSPRAHRLVEIGALGILIVGIAGELLGEARTISIGDQISGLLNEKAGAANERAARAEKEASNADLKAEQLKADNLALEVRLSPRRLSPEDIAKLKAAVRQFKGKSIGMWSYKIDLEARELAMQISNALQGDGLPIVDFIGMLDITWNPQTGVMVEGLDDKLVNALVASLKSVSAVKVPVDPSVFTAGAVIFVGVKPLSP